LGFATVPLIDSAELAGVTVLLDDTEDAIDRPELDKVDERLDDVEEASECERECREEAREEDTGGGRDEVGGGRGVSEGCVSVSRDGSEGKVTMTAGTFVELSDGVVIILETSDLEGVCERAERDGVMKDEGGVGLGVATAVKVCELTGFEDSGSSVGVWMGDASTG
jgi:hypothetical protein